MEKLKIVDLGMNGEGVARLDGKVYFVPFALPQELVEADIKNSKQKYCEAELKNIIESSPKRIQPFCPYFGLCGGCDLQHLNYDEVLKYKSDLVKNTIKKICNIDIYVEKTVPSNLIFGYRNKAVFQCGKKVGMFKRNSHEIVEVDKCLLANENINIVLKIFKDFMNEFDIEGYNYQTHTGMIKNLLVRSENNTTLVCIVATSFDIPNLKYLYEKLSSNFENVGLFVSKNTRKDSTILDYNTKHMFGCSEIKINEFGLNYSVGVESFLQVNTYIKNQIYSKVLEFTKGEFVLDLYAGAGLLSCAISKTAKYVYSIEIVKEASKACEKLITENNIKNVCTINGDCAQVLNNIKKSINDYIAVVDPTEKGCDESVLKNILDAKKIIYISCNEIALSKNINYLKSYFKIEKVIPFDMFPNTKNVETLCIFTHI